MVFNNGTVILLVCGVVIIWILILSVFLFRMISHYNRLSYGITKAGLKEVLEKILKNQEGLHAQTDHLQQVLAGLAADGTLHIQKIGLIRFNPFSDTGGSQSFTLALLDGHDNGLVMTSLYARTGNRWYVKEVVGGKGKEYELSKEEQSAIRKAQPLKGRRV
jgi:competence protein ComGC